MLSWNIWFDKIYCIHYVNQRERVPRISAELKRIGILDSGVFDWFYDYDSPYFKTIQKHGKVLDSEPNKDILSPTKFGFFKCSFTHYRLWKEICCREHKRTLIIEDDEVFLKDLSKLEEIYSNSLDFDICLFDKVPTNSNDYFAVLQRFAPTGWNDNFRPIENLVLFSSGNYSISLELAKYYSSIYDQFIVPSDHMWTKYVNSWRSKDNFKKAFSILNASYQKQYSSCIMGKHLDYFENLYKNAKLNKSFYQDY